MNTSGFYKKDQDEILYAAVFVQGPDVLLVRQERENYTYPVDGWNWFDSQEEAYSAYGLPLPEDQSVKISASYIRPQWAEWRKEMSADPSFQFFLQLIDKSPDSGAKAAWAYMVALLFGIESEENRVEEIIPLWRMISNSADIYPETKKYWGEIAKRHDLPSDFVAAIEV